MTPGQTIECRLVRLAVQATDSEGASFQLRGFLQDMMAFLPNVQHADVMDALKRLSVQQILSLRQWDASNLCFRDYRGEQDDNAFFHGSADFRIKRTPFSRTYLERCEPDELPAELPRRRIGF